METISGGPSDETRDFQPNTILEAAKLNKALENWVVSEVPGDEDGEIGDVVFVTGPGNGSPAPSGPTTGLVHLRKVRGTITADTPLEIKNIFNIDYPNYLIKIDHVADAEGQNISLRLMVGDTVLQETGTYQWVRTLVDYDGTATRAGTQAGGNTTQFGRVCSGQNGQHRHTDIELHWPYVEGHFPTISTFATSGENAEEKMSGYLANTEKCDGLHLAHGGAGNVVQVWVNIFGYMDEGA